MEERAERAGNWEIEREREREGKNETTNTCLLTINEEVVSR